jgi:hypothetical protein
MTSFKKQRFSVFFLSCFGLIETKTVTPHLVRSERKNTAAAIFFVVENTKSNLMIVLMGIYFASFFFFKGTSCKSLHHYRDP